MYIAVSVVAVMVVLFIVGWRYVPSGKLTMSWLGAGVVIEILTYMAGFPWRDALPAEQAVWVTLGFAILGIVARWRGSLS